MIRSSKVSLKFANTGKREALSGFIAAYRDVVEQAVDLLWTSDSVPSLLPQELTKQLVTDLSARAVQCAGKQASGIVRATRDKQKKRLWMIRKLTEENQLVKARKLQVVYDRVAAEKPELRAVNPELDARFVKVDFSSATSFDGWLALSSLGQKLRLEMPFKKTKHFNKLMETGKLRPGVRISGRSATFMFELPDPPTRTDGITLGVDIGQKNTISVSSGWSSSANNHGHSLTSVQAALSRKTKGSKGFARAVAHRTNYINWSINQMDLAGVRQVNRENIRNLRKGKRSSRILSHWTYTEIFDKLDRYCAERGVLVNTVSPTYTSQRCSAEGCGWTRRSNRKGKLFRCGKCAFTLDADLNASRNLALQLPEISRKQRLSQISRVGFYWYASGQEPIVPAVQKPDCPI
jgi:putative transposase